MLSGTDLPDLRERKKDKDEKEGTKRDKHGRGGKIFFFSQEFLPQVYCFPRELSLKVLSSGFPSRMFYLLPDIRDRHFALPCLLDWLFVLGSYSIPSVSCGD